MSIDEINYDHNHGFASMTLILTPTLTMIRYPDHKQDIGQDFYLTKILSSTLTKNISKILTSI